MKRRTFLRGLSAAAVFSIGYTGYRYWPETGLTNPCLSGLPEALRQHPLYREIWQNLDPAQVAPVSMRIVVMFKVPMPPPSTAAWSPD